MKKYSRVSYAVRCQIDIYLGINLSVPQIAKKLGFHKSTIYRELKRNSLWNKYTPGYASELARKRFVSCRRKIKITGPLEKIVQAGLREGWSPEQVAGRVRREKIAQLSHESVYRYTRNNPQYKKFLRWHGRRGYGRYRQRMKRPDWMRSIRERPVVVDQRSRIGDWERDTMYVRDRKTLLVLTERKTRFTLIAKLQTHNAKEVAKVTNSMLSKTGRKTYSVTNDNGGEFRFKEKEPYDVFWCEPHKPQQRGTIENMIGTIRRYVKKDADIEQINVEWLTKLINMKPRKVLDYQTPFEVFYKRKVALAL